MKVPRILVSLLTVVLTAGGLTVAVSAADLAPLYQSKDGLEGSSDWRALGPFFELTTSPDGRRVQGAWPRPFYAEMQQADGARIDRDYLWPLGFSRHRGEEGYEWVIPFLHTLADHQQPKVSERWWLIPFFFHGYNEQGQSYTAVFPAGGTICDLVGYDSVSFRAFPLWLETLKGEVHSKSVLWPFISQTEGPKIEKRRLFPFAGFSRTAKERNSFVLWPFGHTKTQYPDAEGRSGDGWAVLPFYGTYVQRDKDQKVIHEAWTALWPFFSGEKGGKKERLYCPWPFYRRETDSTREGDVDKFHAWPFYGRTRHEGRSSGYVAWPFWQTFSSDDGRYQYQFSVLLPLYWSVEKAEKGQVQERYRQFWPLARWQATPERELLQVLSLWPQRHAEPVERSYAPFWTLYTRDCRLGDTRQEALWGLWQMQRQEKKTSRFVLFPFVEYEAGESEWRFSLFKGLAGWGRDADGGTGQMLWFMSW